MSGQMVSSERFVSLLDAACDGTLVDPQLEELTTLLSSDLQNCKVFIDHVRLRTNIRFLHRAERARDLGFARIEAGLHALPPSPLSHAPTFLSSTLQGALGFFPEGMPLAYLVATVVTGLGLLVGSHVYMSRPEQIARSFVAPVVEQKIVARITGMVDCKWDGTSANSPWVVLGQKYQLASGLMEISYVAGARVILQGPVTYEVDSTNGGYLAVGKLTGKLETKTQDPRPKTQEADIHPSSFILHPFSIHTPTATVTDLGTEFGVEVTPNGATDVHVFKGEVETLQQTHPGGKAVTTRLVAGEAVRVVSAGAPPQRIPFHTATLTANTIRAIRRARKSSPLLAKPTNVVANAYHKIWGIDGKLLAENDRVLALNVVTDGRFGRGENHAGPQSSFDTFNGDRTDTAFVGLIYGRRVRLDRIKVFLGCQTNDGGNWRELPRVFVLTSPVDTGSTPPERDPGNWRELPLQQSFGHPFQAKPGTNPGDVFEYVLSVYPERDRTCYGWALGGVGGNDRGHYVSVTELRGYGEEVAERR